jgi:MYXO-CTERM domain-containing protein
VWAAAFSVGHNMWSVKAWGLGGVLLAWLTLSGCSAVSSSAPSPTERTVREDVVDPLVWAAQGAALPRNDGANMDHFGHSVSVSGNTLLVGAFNKPEGGHAAQGAAYVYVRSGSSWTQQGPALTEASGAINDYFGGAVALSGDTALIGAYEKSDGGAYVFVRSGSTWTQQGPMLLNTSSQGASQFGISVALSGDTALVGASNEFTVNTTSYQLGAAYVFVRSGTTWTQQGSPLLASNGGNFDYFGSSVAIDGDTAVVGAYNEPVGANEAQGAAYVFVRSGTTWTQQGPPLTRTDGGFEDRFGIAVAVSGDTIVVGAGTKTWGADTTAQGAAYVFVRNGTTWTQQGPPLSPGDAAKGDYFGMSVSLAGDVALIGAPQKNSAQGAAYVFARNGTNWTQQGSALLAADGVIGDQFGSSLALATGTAVIGADQATANGHGEQGTGYVFVNGACSSDMDCSAQSYCSAGACVAKCAHDSDCAIGSYCSASGKCQVAVSDGAACSQTAGNACLEAGCRVCSSGHCTDGVCCASACDGVCQACSAALTGAADGTCAPIPADQDPQSECAADPGYPSSCQSDGACDGAGACRAHAKAGTSCGDTVCTQGAVTGKVCDGAGVCSAGSVPCAPYVCGAAACTTLCTTDTDCDPATAYCFNGTCQATKPLGTQCNDAHQCATGFCTDGVCCDSACDGQCQACSAEGKCAPTKGAPIAGRKACAGDPEQCGGSCDGVNVDECRYPSSGTVCAETCDASRGQAKRATCDGKGSCAAPKTTSCGAYACGDTACLTSCKFQKDCDAAYVCANGQCTPRSTESPPTCSDDLSASQTNGVSKACAPYVCDPASGLCHTECASDLDCQTPNVCEASQRCAPPAPGSSSSPAASGSSSSGCGCRVTGSRSQRGSALGVLLLVAVVLSRRKRRLVQAAVPRCVASSSWSVRSANHGRKTALPKWVDGGEYPAIGLRKRAPR